MLYTHDSHTHADWSIGWKRKNLKQVALFYTATATNMLRRNFSARPILVCPTPISTGCHCEYLHDNPNPNPNLTAGRPPAQDHAYRYLFPRVASEGHSDSLSHQGHSRNLTSPDPPGSKPTHPARPPVRLERIHQGRGQRWYGLRVPRTLCRLVPWCLGCCHGRSGPFQGARLFVPLAGE